MNDVPELRRIFGRFLLEEARTVYSIADGDATPATELIISGPRASLADVGKLL